MRNNLKQKTQKLIESEFSTVRTGIEFYGFNDCIKNDDSDAILFLILNSSITKHEGKASIGNSGEVLSSANGKFLGFKYSGASEKKSFVLIRYYNQISLLTNEETFLITALHEFGHLAGLRHTDAQLQDNKHAYCSALQETGIIPVEELGFTASTNTGFDPQSIMSYCYVSYILPQQTGLRFTVSDSGHSISASQSVESLFTVEEMGITEKSLYLKNDDGSYSIKIGLSTNDIKALKQAYSTH